MSQLTQGKKRRLMYIEAKTNANDRGEARIGWVTFSKSGLSVYYQSKRFERLGGQGVSGNFFEVDSGEEYWISGVKRTGTNRHWAGGGPVQIDEDARDEYEKVVKS